MAQLNQLEKLTACQYIPLQIAYTGIRMALVVEFLILKFPRNRNVNIIAQWFTSLALDKRQTP